MDDPIRLIVLKRLTALLETITVANGYRFDLQGAVFRGRKLFGDNDPLPLLSILEADMPEIEAFAGFNRTTRETPWSLVIQGWVANDLKNPSDPAYILAAEVECCLSQVVAKDRLGDPVNAQHYMLGAIADRKYLLSSFKIGSPVVSPPAEQVVQTAHFYLPLQLGLVETAGQPYPNG